ncbi:MAG: MATE family efflux transporter [Ruminococcaceae bacterium]|nr:MATE family efflux transporter [Oscillospiraceae bacterium]
MTKNELQFIKMTETPVWKLVIILGIPTTISMLITNIYNMADTYFVSTLGTAEGGAPSIVFSIMAILQAFGFMFGHGAGSHVSRLLGAKDDERAGKFASSSLLLSTACGLIMMIFGLIFLEPLMWFLGSNQEILPHAMDYARWIFIGAPALTASCVFNNVLRYEGKATFAMIGLTSGGILNIFLDYIFIARLHMGTTGAGLATAISQYVSLIILIMPYLMGKTQSKISFKKGFISPGIVWDIVTTGFPSLIRQGLGSISTAMLNVQARFYGTAAIAAMGYVSKTVQFIFCVGLGIGQGFQPVSAFNYGARKYSRVKKGSYVTMAFGLAFIGALSVVCFALAPQIISFFNSEKDALIAEIGAQALRFNCAVLWVLPFTVVGNMMFQSIGKRIPAILLSALQNGVAFIPMIYLLPMICEKIYGNGLVGLELAQPAAYVITAAITLPVTVVFLSKLPGDGEEVRRKR